MVEDRVLSSKAETISAMDDAVGLISQRSPEVVTALRDTGEKQKLLLRLPVLWKSNRQGSTSTRLGAQRVDGKR